MPWNTPTRYATPSTTSICTMKRTAAGKSSMRKENMTPKVPFRSLIPRGSRRITVAGRILSSDRKSLAGIRAQCTCMAMGQAVGAAAATGGQKRDCLPGCGPERYCGFDSRTWRCSCLTCKNLRIFTCE